MKKAIWGLTARALALLLALSLLPAAAFAADDGDFCGGTQLPAVDETAGVSGLWYWRVEHDNFDIDTPTVMTPSSGSPLFWKSDGFLLAEASMTIGPEPEWTQAAADAGLLKYPFARIDVLFGKDDKENDKSVNFDTLGVKYVRVTARADGPIRFSILNTETAEPGTEPGVFLDNSESYKEVLYELTPLDYGFKGVDDGAGSVAGAMVLPDWADPNKAPEGSDILRSVTGFRWEIKDAKGGTGKISVKSIEFLDASMNPIDPVLLTGVLVPPHAELSASVSGTTLTYAVRLQAGAEARLVIAWFDGSGRLKGCRLAAAADGTLNDIAADCTYRLFLTDSSFRPLAPPVTVK